MADAVSPRSWLATGVVHHRRLRPAKNAFAYRTWFVLLPMRTLRQQPDPALPRNQAGLASFFDVDHGDGGDDALAWAEALLETHGIHDADGEVWLQTYPRVLGYVFKPVSFWYCHRADGTLAAVLAEVNNTFGERHVYLLAGAELAFGREVQARKVFHVSPFCDVAGAYRFRFMRTDGHAVNRIVARIDHHDDAGALLQTSVSGALSALTPATLRRTCFSMPLMTLAVIARIHWQALKLWAKRVPYMRKPKPPGTFVSR